LGEVGAFPIQERGDEPAANTAMSFETSDYSNFARLVLTVLADDDAPPAEREVLSAQAASTLLAVQRALLKLLNENNLAAGWASRTPWDWPLVEALGEADCPHELALLLDPVDEADQWSRSLLRARSKVIANRAPLRSIASTGRVRSSLARRLVQHDITAIAGLKETGRFASPKAVQWGLWEVAATRRLPLTRSWFCEWRLRWLVKQAIRDFGTLHLVIDAPALAEAGTRELRQLERVAKMVGRWQRRGLLTCTTVAGLVTGLLPADSGVHPTLRAA